MADLDAVEPGARHLGDHIVADNSASTPGKRMGEHAHAARLVHEPDGGEHVPVSLRHVVLRRRRQQLAKRLVHIADDTVLDEHARDVRTPDRAAPRDLDHPVPSDRHAVRDQVVDDRPPAAEPADPQPGTLGP